MTASPRLGLCRLGGEWQGERGHADCMAVGTRQRQALAELPAGELVVMVVAALTCAAALLMVDGPWRWVGAAALASLLVLGWRALARAGQELERSRRGLRQLPDVPTQASWLADAQGHTFFMGERWSEWTGVDEDRRSAWIDALHPDDRQRVAAAWEQSVRTGEPLDQEARLCMQDGRYRWMRTRAFPQRDEQGIVQGWAGQVEDVHERKLAEEQLRQTASLLEMIGSSTDSIMWAKDRDGRMLYINRALERLAGVTLGDVLGKTDVEWNPNMAEAEAFQAADRRVLESGQPQDVEERFTAPEGTTRIYRALKSPLRDGHGNIIGVMGVATDTTEQREAEERERLLTRELDHRAKNLLAVVQSVVTLTRASNVADFKQAVEGRIQALGRAHSMLADSRWEGADLSRIIGEELAPFDNGRAGRLCIEGPPLLLRPSMAQSLALVIHELATNAVKYGGLSMETGHLAIRWELDASPAGTSQMRLHWTERGGPVVNEDRRGARSGFGSRLIQSSIKRQLGGSLTLDWSSEGLSAVFEIPLERSSDQPAAVTPRAAGQVVNEAA